MSSSSSPTAAVGVWKPALDLTPAGLSRFDPARVQQAIDDGYAAGFEAGRAEADAQAQLVLDAELAAARQDARQLLHGLTRAVEALARAEDAAAHAFAAQVAEAAVAVAGAIVGRELGDETVAATAAAQRALAALGRERGAVLRLHPADVALLGTGDLPGDVRLVPDPTLARGDALAETDDRTVDARIGTALGRALAVLAGTEEHPA